jgi:hypothetical protein
MDTFAAAIKNFKDLPEDAQKKAGQAIAGDMDAEHTEFVKKITNLINSGKIDTTNPESILNKKVYDSLDAEWKAKTDLAIVNIADLLRHIKEFFESKQTPDSSPQLVTMIEDLWQMKQRIEEHADVFVF